MADEKVIKADAPSTVLAATSPSSKKKKSKTRTPLRRPRGKRGGIKNRKPSGKEGQREEEGTVKRAAQKAHALQIARFHTLEKKLAQTKDEEERARLLAEQTTLGGLQAYQDASLFGGDKSRGGETGKWCAGALAEERGKEKLRLLDVGSLSGTAYAKHRWIEATSIDLNPRGTHVQQYDFFDFPPPEAGQQAYDVVALSLVVNFVGDLAERGRMLLHAHKYLPPLSTEAAGWLFLVLPLACVTNSRYCTHDRLRNILRSCGWAVVRQDDSARLTRWLCRETSKTWDKKRWKKEEIKKGVSLNNFCIAVQ